MCTDSHPESAAFHPGLYVVATPLGNRGDLSPRARRLIEAADVVAAEDTRSVPRLLGSRSTLGTLVSLTEHNVEARIPGLLESALSGVVALVSEAGTPAIADPGTRLVAAAHDRSVPVYAVPGPSALAAALSVSGFNAVPTVFLGFLPKSRSPRRTALLAAAALRGTIVCFESPGRLATMLGEACEALGDPMVVVCREITKAHEEVVRGKASELAARYADTRGECAVVIDCRDNPRPDGVAGARELLGAFKRSGARRTAAASEVARLAGIRRADAYAMWDEA